MIQGIQLSEVCSRDEILDSGLGAFEDEVRMSGSRSYHTPSSIHGASNLCGNTKISKPNDYGFVDYDSRGTWAFRGSHADGSLALFGTSCQKQESST